MRGIFGVIDHPSIDRDRFKNVLALIHHGGSDHPECGKIQSNVTL